MGFMRNCKGASRASGKSRRRVKSNFFGGLSWEDRTLPGWFGCHQRPWAMPASGRLVVVGWVRRADMMPPLERVSKFFCFVVT